MSDRVGNGNFSSMLSTLTGDGSGGSGDYGMFSNITAGGSNGTLSTNSAGDIVLNDCSSGSGMLSTITTGGGDGRMFSFITVGPRVVVAAAHSLPPKISS